MVKLIIGIMLLFAFVPSVVLAQSDTGETDATEIRDVEGLRLQLVSHTQNPETKEVKLEIIGVSSTSSDRVQVSWFVDGGLELLSSELVDLTVKAGEPFSATVLMRPRQFGLSNMVASVEIFSAGPRKSATARKQFFANAEGELLPLTTEYRLLQAAGVIRGVSILGIAVISGYWAFSLVRRLIQKWLRRDYEVYGT